MFEDWYYYLFERRNGIFRNRYVNTKSTGYYAPLERLKNVKGEITLDEIMDFVKMHPSSYKLGGQVIYSGEPKVEEFIGGKKNPFYDNQPDGFININDAAGKTNKILFVPRGKYIVKTIAKRLANKKINNVSKKWQQILYGLSGESH
ncbi:MAG: hypothetical protein LBF08_02830 [Dysgonamonadaceae bacterium]|jgi:hypothetical protein|nr:hypothetical protein [Dysgonamonadaceae bacterium]